MDKNKKRKNYLLACMVSLAVLGLAACGAPAGGGARTEIESGESASLPADSGEAAGETGETKNGEEETDQGGTALETGKSREAREYLEEVVAAVESQYPEETFSDIPEQEMNSDSLFSDSYYFAGRKAQSGWEYIAGVCRTRKNPLEGMTCGNGAGISGFSMSQFDNGRLLIFEKGDSGESRLSYLYDVLQQGKAGIQYLKEAAGRGVCLVPPAEGPFLKVSMVKNGYPVTEFLPLTGAEAERLRQGTPADGGEQTGWGAIRLLDNRDQLPVLADAPSGVTVEMAELARETCGFQTGAVSELRDIAKAEMKMHLYGEIRRETVENRDDLDRLESLFSTASGEALGEETELAGVYPGVITLTKTDGTVCTVQLALEEGGCVLGNASRCRLSGENAAGVWSVFSIADGFKKYGAQIRMQMAEPSYPMDAEKLEFVLENGTGKPIQYILSPIVYKKQSVQDEDGNDVWKRLDSVAGFCGFLSPMDGEELELEVPWNGAFVPEGPGIYKLEIQVMPEDELRFEISDTFELEGAQP